MVVLGMIPYDQLKVFLYTAHGLDFSVLYVHLNT